jgi:hypothetical protein
VPALPYVLLRALVEERYRAHSLLDFADLQSGPIQACLLAHQLSDELALLFFAQVSRYRLLFVSYRTSYDTRTEAVTNFREWRLDDLRRMYLLRTRVNRPQEGARRMWGGVSVLKYSSSSGVEVRPSISLRCGWRPKRAITSRTALA